MKWPIALLAGSLIANAAFVAALGSRLSSAKDHSQNEIPQRFAPVTMSVTKPVPPRADSWDRLNEGSLEDLAARLRGEEFPESVRRAIITALLNKRFAARRDALAATRAALPYWRTSLGFHNLRLTAENRMLQRDFDAQLRQLLQPGSTGLTDFQREELGRLYGNPSPKKIERLQAIQLDYDDLAVMVRSETNFRLTPADREKLAELERQRLADLAELLTPLERENYEMGVSPTAKRLRSEMRAFSFTDDEFRALFQIQQTIDLLENLSDQTAWQRARAERQDRFRDALGSERFAEFQLTTHSGYLVTKRFVVEQGLPDSTTAALIGIQRNITERANSLGMAGLSQEERQMQITALAQEANARLVAAIGLSGVNQLGPAGVWLRDLHQAAASAPQR